MSTPSTTNKKEEILFWLVVGSLLSMMLVIVLLSIIYIFRNNEGKGNRILFTDKGVILPTKNWPINPFCQKEKFEKYCDLIKVEEVLRYGTANTKDVEIVSQSSTYIIKEKHLNEPSKRKLIELLNTFRA